jgi:2-amino-4-hydroxy-6-hydroxymethyldihydropteridine diphosphokinase
MGHLAYLSLGSNQGKRLQTIEAAYALIEERIGQIQRTSQVYSTPPVGFESEEDFLNTCIIVRTDLNPTETLSTLHIIEKELGRIRPKDAIGYSSRTIDIDIILFDQQIIDTKTLKIPHPRYSERLFVLVPLSEIAAKILDPFQNKTIKQLKQDCIDESTLTIYEEKNPPNE